MKEKTLPNETTRIEALHSYQILDTSAEQAYDEITKLASEICETPIALMSLVDVERQWFKSKIGIEDTELPRATAFCSHAIQEPNDIFTVENAQTDERFASNPFVLGEAHIRFYAGAPLVTGDGEALGTLCVIDRKPRRLNEKQKLSLRVLARQVVVQMEMRRTIRQMQAVEARQKETAAALRESEDRFRAFMNNSPVMAYMKDQNGCFVYVNRKLEQLFDPENAGLLGKTDFDLLSEDAAKAVRKNDAQVLSEWQPLERLEEAVTPDGSASHWLSLKFPFLGGKGEKFLGGVSIDVTARQSVEDKLNESERRYRHLFELSPGFINTHRLDGVITSVNEAAADALGYRTDEMVGNNLADFLIPESRPFFAEYLQRMSRTAFEEGVFYVLTKSGARRAWQYRNRLYDKTGEAGYVIGYAQDITELKETQKELLDLSLTDELTQLYNRRGFFALADQALRYARRSGKSCIVIYADLDNLKAVNDRFGHEVGSQMIVDAANIFKSFFRDSDVAGRLGGDEFVVFAQDCSEAGTETIKKRIEEYIAEFNRSGSRPFSLSISLGVAQFDPKSAAVTLEELVAEADRLMYLQKHSKKNSADEPAPSPK